MDICKEKNKIKTTEEHILRILDKSESKSDLWCAVFTLIIELQCPGRGSTWIPTTSCVPLI